MLRTCAREAWERGRVVVFVEPIALYMTRDLHEANDKAWTFLIRKIGGKIAVGEFGVWGEGKELTIITYGNGYYYSRQAARFWPRNIMFRPKSSICSGLHRSTKKSCWRKSEIARISDRR